MKRIYIFFLLAGLIAVMNGSVNAQILSTRQNILFEHFANTNCGPCAAQNPNFRPIFWRAMTALYTI